MRPKNYALVFIIIAVILTAGCLGQETGDKTKTVTVEKTETFTKTITITKTVIVENKSAEAELRENLTRCTEELSLLNATLNQTRENLIELAEKYRECITKGQEGTKENFSQPELLIDGEYYMRLINDLKSAKKSIYVTMFLMKYDPADSYDHANDLIRALVEARRRGVSVHVVLENSIDDNRAAYNYLRSNGVDVVFDSPSTTLHTKMVIIDGRIVYIGSHNWSEAALDWNHEVSVRIESREMADVLLNYFNEIRRGF